MGNTITNHNRLMRKKNRWKEMTMSPTEYLILTITTSVVVIVLGVWFYRLTHGD